METLIRTLAQGIKGRHWVLAAYLFGSIATGHARSGSNVDIGFRLVAGLPVKDRFRFRTELIECMEKRTARAVDVAIWNHAALELVNQVFLNGIVEKRDVDDRKSFAADVHACLAQPGGGPGEYSPLCRAKPE